MKTGYAAGIPESEWIFSSLRKRNLTFNTSQRDTMFAPQLKRSVVLWALFFIWTATGLSKDGRMVWERDHSLSPVNESQLFLHDTFPTKFIWGVGTSAFQVEGTERNDGKGPSIWEHFNPSHSQADSRTDNSSDSYNFLQKDLSALDFLGVSSYQFSISWPRLFPTGMVTAVNEKGLRYYNHLLDALVLRQIEPVVTLYHWDLPLALQEKYGGWANESLIDVFNDYASFCFQAFGDRVKYWITIHNPYLIAWHGYSTGIHAPGEMEESAAYTVGHNLIKAHAKVWHNYDKHFRPHQKGFLSITLGSHWIEPNRFNNQLDITKCQQSMQRVLGWFAKPIHGNGDYPEELKAELASILPNATQTERNYIKGTADFFAFSFGPHNFIPTNTKFKMGQNFSLNLRGVLNWIKLEYDNPRILITENGWFSQSPVTSEDTTIIYMMKKFINKVLQAIKYDEIDVFGYTAWSLMDGFEWHHDYDIRRGLFYIDFNSKEKEWIPKSSAFYYKQIVKENGFPMKESIPILHGQFPCDFSWGMTESVIKAETVASSPQFCDPNLYLWNITGDGLFHQVKGVKLKTRPAQCTDFVSIKTQLELLSKIKITHYRFALSWSLLLPSGELSSINRQVLRYYRCVIREMLKLRVQPVITLYYPTHRSLGLPSPLLHNGGWLNQSTVQAFRNYAEICFQELGDLVQFWITINEPNRLSDIYSSSSKDTYQAAHNLLIAHALAWHVYDKQYRSFQHGLVSLSLHSDWAEPANPFVDTHRKAAERFLQFEVAWFSDPIFKTGDYPVAMREYINYKNSKGLSNSSLPYFTDEENKLVKGAADFYALNHFTTRYIMHESRNGSRYEFDQDVQFLQDRTCLSSPSRSAIVPWGLRKNLNWIKKHYGNIDIYVTASGIDDHSNNDVLRKYYLEKYVQEALKAYHIDKVNVRGYFAFKLTDEQSKPRFGFFSSEPKAKPSVQFYNQLISNSGFPLEPTNNVCGQPREKATCTLCLFLVQKKPLIFFGCCLFTTLILFLSIIIFHKRKRRKWHRSKNSQVSVPVKTRYKNVLNQI
ncbi:LOW QUALITY PROTEIN: beta-klotho [Hemicordylus capensis]|uniref:LOW QUALITY PROTEIN: beta-klotho n=1 Tax=Hemicordylus capensis TaxID=884348 RepID=UPI0023026839|nr:LOW QUALITY PROTEIN: beta-klotho [Hemicordylus capensis]